MSKYPNSDKLVENDQIIRTLMDFHDWLRDNGMEIADEEKVHDFASLIHKYLGVDRAELSRERNQMLDEMRKAEALREAANRLRDQDIPAIVGKDADGERTIFVVTPSEWLRDRAARIAEGTGQ